MPFTYVNHWGVTYYLNEATSPAGKPTYSFTKKPGAKMAEALPDGFEVYERPQSAQPFLRKVQSTLITSEELELVRTCCLAHHRPLQIRVLAEPNAMVLYYSSPPSDDLLTGLSGFLTITPAKREALFSTLIGPLQPELRFRLLNPEQRTFAAESWSCKGLNEGWLPMGLTQPLEPLVRSLVPHLGRDSLYESI